VQERASHYLLNLFETIQSNRASERMSSISRALNPEKAENAEQKQDFYALTAELNDGELYNFSSLKGRAVLIVNVASKCGFTAQYAGLEKLYETYKNRGLTILGFPCNQFGDQEPGTDQEIALFCKRTYNITFPIMKKIDVNGDNTHPVYQFLKSQKTSLGMTRIKWNFEKFLVDSHGQVVDRYVSTTTPDKLVEHIEKVLPSIAERVEGMLPIL